MEAAKKRDIEFAHRSVRVVALKTVPEIKLVGVAVGPFEEGEAYSLPYWIAEELEKLETIKIGEENLLSVEQIERLRWLQSTQKSKLLALPPDFYPMAKRLVEKLSEKTDAAGMKAHERARHTLQDIVDMRTAVLVGLAVAMLEIKPENFTPEEDAIYEHLREFMKQWKQYFDPCLAPQNI
jgi:hypothetical protein